MAGVVVDSSHVTTSPTTTSPTTTSPTTERTIHRTWSGALAVGMGLTAGASILAGCAVARPRASSLSPAPAEAVARELADSGMPVRVSMRYTSESDPDGLLGRAGGYLSKLAFVDSRVNGGVVADGDPGSVSLGGVIEVFATGARARERATRLQQAAVGIPTLAEYDVLAGRALIRLSRYLPARAAAQYRAITHGVEVGPSPGPPRPPSPSRV